MIYGFDSLNRDIECKCRLIQIAILPQDSITHSVAQYTRRMTINKKSSWEEDDVVSIHMLIDILNMLYIY